jgi:hypothetical protein
MTCDDCAKTIEGRAWRWANRYWGPETEPLSLCYPCWRRIGHTGGLWRNLFLDALLDRKARRKTPRPAP